MLLTQRTGVWHCRFPGNAFHIFDDEALFKQDSTVVYSISVDFGGDGNIHLHSFGGTLHVATMPSRTFGAGHVLRVNLPEKLGDSEPEIHSRWRQLHTRLTQGIELFGYTYRPLGTKSDQNQRDTKLYMLASAPKGLPNGGLLSCEGWRWDDGAMAVYHMAGFDQLKSHTTLLKRLDLLFSSARSVLCNKLTATAPSQPDEDADLMVEEQASAPEEVRPNIIIQQTDLELYLRFDGAHTVLCDAVSGEVFPIGTHADGKVNVIICEDIKGRCNDGSVATDANGEEYILTDGAGLISLNLAEEIPQILGGRLIGSARDEPSAPLVAQVSPP